MADPWHKRRHYPRKPCAIEGCKNLTAPGGGRICGTHQWRWRHYRDYHHDRRRPVEERFWEKVDRSDGCWLWTSTTDRDGYGVFTLDRKQVRAHRLSYALAHNIGAVPSDLYVMHECDNPPCVNPSHLLLGTSAENGADAARKGRRLPGSQNHQAKLKESQVLELRQTYASGGVTQKQLAAKYGVSLALVSFIVTRKAWRHI